jgi:hypothetical protein
MDGWRDGGMERTTTQGYYISRHESLYAILPNLAIKSF